MGKQAFEKFIKKEPTGAKKKEMIRQEKRKSKKEAREAGEAYRLKKREERYGVQNDRQIMRKPKDEARGTKFATGDDSAKKLEKKDKPYTKKEAGDKTYNKRSTPAGRAQKSNTQDRPRKFSDDKTAGRAAKRTNKTGSPRHSAPQTHSRQNDIHAKNTTGNDEAPVSTIPMPLNKFVAHSGVCGRREAAELVKQGKVTVNGTVITEPGYKVSGADTIKANGKLLFLQHNLVYILLNKPKDFITTAKDPEGRKTVFDLIGAATKERVYSVGRLDRNTTGVLLLTNDGELAQKLTHPSYEVKKVYEVKLDKPLTKKDFDTILTGITLEDGFVVADTLAYADSKDKSIIGIEIHSGRNRIVRRIFEHLGYDVRGLDRVMFANLAKKNVDRGKWRYLNEKEVRLLKYMNQSFVRKNKQAEETTD